MTLSDALKHFKNKSCLADALGIRPQAVAGWGDRIPIGRQFQIEVLTKGALKADRTKQTA